MQLYQDAQIILHRALEAALPDEAVRRALEDMSQVRGRIILIAAGKAAWRMARAAVDILGKRIAGGVVVTKYGHAAGPLPPLTIFEAGHPVPDENGFRGTQAAIDAVRDLTGDDLVLFLLSGGGSALFEKPLIPGKELGDITRQLLACGADIVEINMIRKRLSAVKGGRFAQLCAPARVYTVALSDVLGDVPDMIASGPTCPDSTTSTQALEIVKKYDIRLSDKARALLLRETPKQLDNVTMRITGSVRELCRAAARAGEALGYRVTLLTDRLDCEAREAGAFLAAIAQTHAGDGIRQLFIAGGETVVHLRGTGLGGRNQELALAASRGIAGLKNVLIASLGSDGTDGPTDAAGGYVTGDTAEVLTQLGIDTEEVLNRNDSHTALAACGEPMRPDTAMGNMNGGLIMTGPTGTNVNDISIVLIG